MKKPEISDAEIGSYMDFDRLLIQHQNLKSVARDHFLKKIMFGSSVVLVGLIVGLWIYEKSEDQKNTPSKTSEEKSIPLASVPSDSAQAKSQDPIPEKSKTIPEVQTPEAKKKSKSTTEPRQKTESKQNEERLLTEDKKTEPTVTAQPVYVQAEPLDGYPALYHYFASELKYPEAMVKDSIQGVVMVMFTINAKGQPEKIAIDQSLGKPFDDEAARLITNMPAWKPATYNEKPVPSRISLPITFQIRKLKSEQ